MADSRQEIGYWTQGNTPPSTEAEAATAAIRSLGEPVAVVNAMDEPALAAGGCAVIGRGTGAIPAGAFPLLAWAPAVNPGQFGDPDFRAAHGVRHAYVGGEMAYGIASEEMAEALSQAGMLGFFGSAGCDIARIEKAVDRLQGSLGHITHGFNLIHSPAEPSHEAAVADLYLRRGVRLVGAAAYLDLTLPIVRYRVAGIGRDDAGRPQAPNALFAKVSRVEVARRFLAPPPEDMLRALVDEGFISADQAVLAAQIPMAGDITAEADSGGHTDNRPAITLLPTMTALRDEMQARHRYTVPPRVGLGGGIATPASAAAAFALGAAYVVTGTVNQACVESGTSDAAREMLAQASQADVVMAPAADMFEMGVKVQVLKRGTMFPMRARRLYELYTQCAGMDDIPAAARTQLERDFFRSTLEEAWAGTRAFFEQRDPSQIERAERDPKHQMALVFRKYLGQSARWAVAGDPARRADYQVWCGPGIGAFNEWARGSFLEQPANRRVVTVALNLLVGASVLTRVACLRTQGVRLPPESAVFPPLERTALEEMLG